MDGGGVRPIAELTGGARWAVENTPVRDTGLGIGVVAAHRSPAVAELAAASTLNAIEHLPPPPLHI